MKRIPALVSFAALVLFAAFLVVPAATAQDEQPNTFVPSDCMFEGLDLGVAELTGERQGYECGYVIVPERHDQPDGRTIHLPVAIRRAAGATARPDPLFLAQGGPGGDAFSVFTLLASSAPFAAERDIVIFNQRGTKYAEPDLSCPETFAVLGQVLNASTDEGETIYNDAIRACRDRLVAEGVDLSAYNSLENAADVESIREALGYDEYNFYGVSYGTLLGLHLMRQNPEGLRSVILDSVVPTQTNFVPETPASENRVYDELFAACAADPACAVAYPNLEQRYFDVVGKLDAEPVELTLKNTDTGESYAARLDGQALRGIMYQLFYVPRMPAVFPKLVSDLEKGDYRYIEAMWPLFAFDDSVSEGMYFSVICAEDADFNPADTPLADLRPEIAASAEADLQSYLDTCTLWNVDELPAGVDDPVTSDIPTLLLAGRFDPITPPAFAQEAAAGLSNSTVVVDPQASHGVAFLDPCVNTIVAAFLDDPAATPDTSCLATQAALETVPPNAITLPLLAGINSLERGTVIQFGLAGLLLFVLMTALVIWPIVFLGRAIGDHHVERTPSGKSVRWASRILVVVFTLLAALFGLGLFGFVIAAVADQTLATALALSPSAAPLFWAPIFLLLLAAGIVVAAVLLWRTPGSGSKWGKVYYALLAAAAVGIVVLIAGQSLLLPPL